MKKNDHLTSRSSSTASLNSTVTTSPANVTNTTEGATASSAGKKLKTLMSRISSALSKSSEKKISKKAKNVLGATKSDIKVSKRKINRLNTKRKLSYLPKIDDFLNAAALRKAATDPILTKSTVFLATSLVTIFSLVFESVNSVANAPVINIGVVRSIGMLVELLNLVQWGMRLNSFLKLRNAHKSDPNSLSKADLAKLEQKTTLFHVTKTTAEFLYSFFSIMGQVYNIISLFVPGLKILTVVNSLLAVGSRLFYEGMSLVSILKDKDSTGTDKTLQVAIVALNALSVAFILIDGVLSTIFPPATIISNVVYAVLEVLYLVVSSAQFRAKVKHMKASAIKNKARNLSKKAKTKTIAKMKKIKTESKAAVKIPSRMSKKLSAKLPKKSSSNLSSKYRNINPSENKSSTI